MGAYYTTFTHGPIQIDYLALHREKMLLNCYFQVHIRFNKK